jgi:hypothetical protein
MYRDGGYIAKAMHRVRADVGPYQRGRNLDPVPHQRYCENEGPTALCVSTPWPANAASCINPAHRSTSSDCIQPAYKEQTDCSPATRFIPRWPHMETPCWSRRMRQFGQVSVQHIASHRAESLTAMQPSTKAVKLNQFSKSLRVFTHCKTFIEFIK